MTLPTALDNQEARPGGLSSTDFVGNPADCETERSSSADFSRTSISGATTLLSSADSAQISGVPGAVCSRAEYSSRTTDARCVTLPSPADSLRISGPRKTGRLL